MEIEGQLSPKLSSQSKHSLYFFMDMSYWLSIYGWDLSDTIFTHEIRITGTPTTPAAAIVTTIINTRSK